MDITTEIFTIIWTAGFNSCSKISRELAQETITMDDVKKRADELIKQDGLEIKELLRLKRSMEE